MKVVALVSGGKDSCFAMMRCIDFGHEVVALANLIPLDDSVDELDSYMYQTAGHQIIVSYAHCMGLPLFRRRIHGTSREVGADYRATKGDEVEDMYALLHEVKRRLPCVNAVCSGAIASDYQRVRVESVCSRLGLVSFAFLWKQDQTLLLEDMIRRGIVAITVKVAAMGLNPSEHLGKELSYLKPKLFALKEKFGINVCGEGGEYESLTLDCPLFHNARIILDKYDVLLQSEDSVIAPVGVLHPSAFHLEQKHGSSGTDRTSDVYQVDDNPVPNSQSQPLNSESDTNVNLRISSTETTKTFSIGCWILSTSNGLKEDLTTILKQIESQLNSNGLDWVNVLYVHLYISNMKLFALANEVYVNHITSSKCRFGVPSRSTIELPLTQSQLGNAYVEVMVAKEPNLKKVLHVQSISCWAPSCIGPYSQATKYMKVLYMAGQLGLDPPTMELCQGGPTFELEQALRNSEAIAQCFDSSIFSSTFLFVIYCSARLTSSEKTLIQEKFEIFSRGPAFLYILAPDLPKGASVEVKPVLYIRDTEEENEEREIEMKELQVSKSEMQLDESCFKIRNMNNGKICSAIISVTKNTALNILCSQEDKCDFEYVSNKELKSIANFCASLVSRIIKENSFSWDDLVSLRFYYGTKLSSSGVNMADIFSVAFSELAQVDESVKIYEEPFFNLVPVLGSGQSASMDDVITCELFASKL